MMYFKSAYGYVLLALTTLFAFFQACDDLTDLDDEVTVTATLNYTGELEVGETITITAAATASDGSTPTIEWQPTGPVGSTATLQISGNVAVFVPDVAGDYSIQIVATSGNASDTEVLNLTVAAPTIQTIEINQNISEDFVMTNQFEDPSVPDYIITSSIGVNAKLTIEPGVLIHLNENVEFAINSGGQIIAEGTADSMIEMTSANQAAELYWRGLFIKSSSALNQLNYVKISYAGQSALDFFGENFVTSVGVDRDARVGLQNCTIQNSKGYGIFLSGNSTLNGFSNNIITTSRTGLGTGIHNISEIESSNDFSANTVAAVEIFGSSINENEPAMWTALSNDLSYTISGNITINDRLDIMPGTKIELDENVLLTVGSSGSLVAKGNVDSLIVMTSSDTTAELYWKGILINSNSALNNLSYCDISYAGSSAIDFFGENYAVSVGVERDARLGITNSIIRKSKNIGLFLGSTATIQSFERNQFKDGSIGIYTNPNEVYQIDGTTTFENQTRSEVEIYGGTHAQDNEHTWNKLLGDAAYYLESNLTIAGDLALAPGTILEIEENVQITISGSLAASGSASDSIIFTSADLENGLHWKGLLFTSGSAKNALDFAIVEYAGNTAIDFFGENFQTNIGVDRDGALTLTNSRVSNSKGYGVRANGTINNAEDPSAGNTFYSNPLDNFLNLP
jgi:hypothetical protein